MGFFLSNQPVQDLDDSDVAGGGFSKEGNIQITNEVINVFYKEKGVRFYVVETVGDEVSPKYNKLFVLYFVIEYSFVHFIEVLFKSLLFRLQLQEYC